MPFKPVGIDESSHFPPRVRIALAEEFVTKPSNIGDGQVPVWDAATQTWVAGGGSGWDLPPAIDGGVWDPDTNDWIHGATDWNEPVSTDVDGGTPTSD